MAVPTVPISLRMGEYSKQYSLLNVTGLSNFFYAILAQYSGHYVSGSRCKPDQNETRCERLSVPIQSNEGCRI